MLDSVRARAAAMPPPLAGFLMIVLAAAFFASMHNTIRFVTVAEGIHPFEAAFFRNLFGVIVFIPWLVKNGFGHFRTKRFGMHLGRAGLNSISSSSKRPLSMRERWRMSSMMRRRMSPLRPTMSTYCC